MTKDDSINLVFGVVIGGIATIIGVNDFGIPNKDTAMDAPILFLAENTNFPNSMRGSLNIANSIVKHNVKSDTVASDFKLLYIMLEEVQQLFQFYKTKVLNESLRTDVNYALNNTINEFRWSISAMDEDLVTLIIYKLFRTRESMVKTIGTWLRLSNSAKMSVIKKLCEGYYLNGN